MPAAQKKAEVAVIKDINGGVFVIPGTIIVSKRDKYVMIRNYAGRKIAVSGSIRGEIRSNKKRAFDISALRIGVYEYQVKVREFIALGNSSPRLIIDE